MDLDKTTDREDSTVNSMPGARSSTTHLREATLLKEATQIDLFQEEAITAITAAIAPLVWEAVEGILAATGEEKSSWTVSEWNVSVKMIESKLNQMCT